MSATAELRVTGRGEAVYPVHVQGRALEHDLREAMRGKVLFDSAQRAMYAHDASNYRQVPIGIVRPVDAADVVAAVAVCRKHQAPLVSRGGGTSIAGQAVNVAVVLDFAKYMNRIIEIDANKKTARVQPGVICDHLKRAVQTHGLTWGPAPATHQWCTFGGMIGNNSCGINSQICGRTSDNIESLDILTYDGCRMRVGRTSEEELDRIIRDGGRQGEIFHRLRNLRDRNAELIRRQYPKIPRRVSGYNLDELLPENGFNVARALVGTESTCVTILEATVQLISSPPCRTLVVCGFGDVPTAGNCVAQVAAHGPFALEGLDRKFIRDLRKKNLHVAQLEMFPKGDGFLLIEFGGQTQQEADDAAQRLVEELKRYSPQDLDTRIYSDRKEADEIWSIRESGLGATAHVPGEKENYEGWEDSAVPPERVGEYLHKLKELLDKYNYNGALYGHWGQGCIHTRLDFDLKTAAGIHKFHTFLEEAADLVTSLGGSLSGEHGDGQSRAELLPKMFGPELVRAFEEFKAIWDPNGRMNPGKIVHPNGTTQNLNFGPDYSPARPQTHFRFPDDHHDFATATERCVGVGKCRREEAGTMCPSYMVLREEMHTTRGRARMLHEMLRGDVIDDGWRSDAVKESLDLCLSCKGCKGDCPVHVDIATYKAEFLSHYYDGRLRPRQAYAFGLAPVVSFLGSFAPTLANFVTQTPGLRSLAKWAAGMEQRRGIPALAPQSFQRWWAAHARKPAIMGHPTVLLFPDTFNNFYHPETAQAAVEVLENAGFNVEVPTQHLCCGRPLYDYGFLDRAKAWLRHILTTLRPYIRNGVPIVVLEPSCWAVFHDEMTNLFPDDHDANRLRKQCFMLGQFLREKAKHYRTPLLRRQAVLHRHCHHKALVGNDTTDEREILDDVGLDVRELDSGCCGMAGAFGFEAGDHYVVSVACGERVLLPAVRSADDDAVIVADGFSCREQIAQCTDRHALHLAEVLQLALHQDQDGRITDGRSPRPEAALVSKRRQEMRHANVRAATLLVCGLILGIVGWHIARAGESSKEASR